MPAVATLRKYHPQIVAITGSVGKTSAKEAIFCVLGSKYAVRRSLKNYNNEIGLPLTILGQEKTAGKNIFKWLGIFIVAIKNLLFTDKNYPQVLILEMGADRPDNIRYLTKIARPNLAVITTIGQSHIQYFGSEANIAKEKATIFERLAKDEWAIVNHDDPRLRDLIPTLKCRVMSFGQVEDSDVKISQVHLTKKENVIGTTFKLHYKGADVPIFLPNILGWQHAQAAVTAVAVGLAWGMNLVEISQALQNYKPAPGRTNLVAGVKNT